MNGTLPTSLIDYREALEHAVRRDLGRSPARRRRGLALRWALAGALVAAAALGALSFIARDGAGPSVVDRAAAAVAPSPGTILHVDMHGFQDNGDGTTITWRDESWQQQGPPHDGRQIQTSPDGTVTESGTDEKRQQVQPPPPRARALPSPARWTPSSGRAPAPPRADPARRSPSSRSRR